MKMLKPCLSVLGAALIGTLTGCSTSPDKPVDVSSSIHTSLDQAGFKDVSTSDDVDKGVVTLSGHVASDAEKSQAETIAKGLAGTQVVSNQIAVVPPGIESEAKAVNADLDKAIEKNLDAALIQAKLHDDVKYSVKNHVVTLSGEVNSQAKRTAAEKVAVAVLNVQQVVNELQVKGQKATTSH